MYDLLMNDNIQKTLAALTALGLFFLLNWYSERQARKTTPPPTLKTNEESKNSSSIK